MRTHLLRTFYPSPAAEPDTGCAANDADCDPPPGAAKAQLRTATTLPVADRTDEDDDYQLGGYAGI
jgi:hypothetical protein